MVEECNDTRIQGLRAVSTGRQHQEKASGYLLGWKAIPLALEDLDSNLVNMLGDEAMVELRAKPQLQERAEQLQCRRCRLQRWRR
jgi:hypothetical protein